MQTSELSAWLDEVLPRHVRLTDVVLALVKSLLREHQDKILEMVGRTKSKSTTIEKVSRKGYQSPNSQLTDLTGIRVIVFFESQIELICSLLRQVFEVVEDGVSDHTRALAPDRFGYRSMHLTCKLGERRDRLLEYKDITDLQFEIQVRTVLQHAWAELAHDRAYKFGGSLPENIQRRINLCSAILEMMDREFVSIVDQIQDYNDTIASQSEEEFRRLGIDSLSLGKYLTDVMRVHKLITTDVTNPASMQVLKKELAGFGIINVGHLDSILTKRFFANYKKYIHNAETTIGFIRTAMMYNDIDKYLRCWDPWTGIDTPTHDLLVDKYGSKKVISLLMDNRIELIDEFDLPDEEDDAGTGLASDQ